MKNPNNDSFLISLLTPLRVLFFFIAVPVLLFIIILLLTVSKQAITQSQWTLSQQDIQHALAIVNSPKSKQQQTIKLSEKDLNIALSYLLNHYAQTTSHITVEPDHLKFKISVLLNRRLSRRYLNFSFRLSKRKGYPIIESLQIGKIQVADEFAGIILEKIINYTPLQNYYILLAQHIKNIQISQERLLTINYITLNDLELKRRLSLSNVNFQRVLVYQQLITQVISQHNPKIRLSLADLFIPLFKLAYHRSNNNTAIAENRAALIAISTYVNKSEIEAYIPFDIGPEIKRAYPTSLYRRTDMAKHFVASAVLAATGAEGIAQHLGLQKELNDAKKGGSGFSFVDLAGDRAGLKFGKRAVSSSENARKLQKMISESKDYCSFMPEVRDLPEHMTDKQFKQKYHSIYSPEYQQMLKKIDQRIAKLEIYQ